MRSAFILALLLLPAQCCAQSADRVEIYGGYAFVNNDFTGGTLFNNAASLKRGWNASANFKINKWWQFVADFGGHYLSLPVCNFQVGSCSSSVHTLMFGPQLSFHTKVTPFVHALFGAALASQSSGTVSNLKSNHSFAEAVGAGVDYVMTHHFGLRAQVDYLGTHFNNADNQVAFDNGHARISGGVIIRF
jgi:outer membrane protein with beta-barrel domain